MRPAMGGMPMGGMPMGGMPANVPMQQQYGAGGFVPQVPLMPSTGPAQTTPINDPFGAL